MTIPRRLGNVALLVILLSCGQEPRSEEPFNLELPQPEVLVSTESELIGRPSDIALDSEGHIWVADLLNKRVVLLGRDGRLIRTIGREGDGPGEFRWPMTVVANDSLVRVYDPGHRAIQDYRPDGTHLADHPGAPVGPSWSGAALSVTGSLVVGNYNGEDGALATLRRLNGPAVIRLGPLVVPPATPQLGLFELSEAIKAEAKKNGFPEQLRNMVIPAVGDHETVWLLVQTEREVRKYSRDGSLLWQRTLEVPEVETVLQEFFRRTTEEESGAPAFPPIVMGQAREVKGTLWVLLHGEEGRPTVFYLLNSDTGDVQGRLSAKTSAPVRGFYVDAARKRLYLVIPDQAAIHSVDLRSATALSWE
jgi:hypothetical protein